MKRVLVLIAFTILLTGLVFAAQGNASNGNSDNSTGNQNTVSTANQNKGNDSQEQIKTQFKERDRLKIHSNASECPTNCTCTGSATKCWINGQREMTIEAGNSGNIIVQVKGIKASTNVTLYKSEDGKLYRVTKNNEKKRILSPDQVQEKIKEKLKLKDCSCDNLELDENGIYQVDTQKEAKLLGLLKVREKVQLKINAENGEITRTKNSWWGFLARDVKEEDLIVGASCGTVTPGQNDACCQTKGYDKWDSGKSECILSE